MTRFLRTLRTGLTNLVRWFLIIWRDRDWDHAYLLDLLRFKLERMAEYHEKHGITVSAPQIARQLRLTALVCDRLSKDAASADALARFPFPEDWEITFKEIPGTDLCELLCPPDPNGDKRRALERRLHNRDKALLGKLISKYIDHWWD